MVRKQWLSLLTEDDQHSVYFHIPKKEKKYKLKISLKLVSKIILFFFNRGDSEILAQQKTGH